MLSTASLKQVVPLQQISQEQKLEGPKVGGEGNDNKVLRLPVETYMTVKDQQLKQKMCSKQSKFA